MPASKTTSGPSASPASTVLMRRPSGSRTICSVSPAPGSSTVMALLIPCLSLVPARRVGVAPAVGGLELLGQGEQLSVVSWAADELYGVREAGVVQVRRQ